MGPEYDNDGVLQKTAGIGLEQLKLSVRLYNCLKRGGYNSLQEVMETPMEEFSKIRNFGKTSAEELMSLRAFVLSSTREALMDYCYGSVYGANDVSIDCYKETGVTVIEIALTGEVDSEKVVFQNDLGCLCHDIDLYEIGFSVRTDRVLRENSINTLRGVAMLPYYSLMSFEGLGKKSIDEVLEVVRKRAVTQFNLNNCVIPEGLLNRINGLIAPIVRGKVSSELANEIKSSISSSFVDQDMMILSDEQLADALFQCKTIKTYAYRAIWLLVPEEIYRGVDKSVFFEALSDYNECAARIIRLEIESLLENRKLRVVNGKICKYKLFLNEWLDTLDEKRREVVEAKCQGLTLEEIGQKYGVTRERIRQMLFKSLRVRPELYEDDYSYFIEKYFFSNEELSKLLSLSAFQINYLLLNHKRGIKDVQELLVDEQVPEHIKERIASAFKKSILLLDGECVPIKRDALMNVLMKVYFSDRDCSVEEFEGFYLGFLREHNLADRDILLFPNLRAMEARLCDCAVVVMKGSHRVRYYDLEKLDINELLLNMNISRYNDLEISTLKLVRDNPEIMERYDIRDEYELHNILRKKCGDVVVAQIGIQRMPFISIGEANRDKQVEDLLLQMTPVSNIDLAAEYEERYGVRKETALANFFKCIDVFYHDGVFSLDQQSLSKEDYATLKSKLNKDFYLWDDIVGIYNRVSKAPNLEAINPMTLKSLGFRVYSQYVIRASFPSAENYFSQWLLEKQSINIQELPGEIRYIQTFYAALASLRDSYDLIEVDRDVYYRFDLFSREYAVDDKNMLSSLADDIVTQIKEEYFSVDRLSVNEQVNGFFGVTNNPYILNSIIRVHPEIKTGRIGNTYIGTRRNNDLSLLGLICHIVKKHGEIGMAELINVLKDEYGLSFERSRILYITEKTNEITYDAVFDYLCLSDNWSNYKERIYLLDTRYADTIQANIGLIEASDSTIDRVYWEGKYSTFVDYCVAKDYHDMKDLLKIDFYELYSEASQLGFPRGAIAGIVSIFLEWISGLRDGEALEEVLCVTRKQVEGDSQMADTTDNRAFFLNWLSSNCPKGLSSRDVITSMDNGSKMCLKYQFSDKSFWSMSTAEEYSKVADRLLAALRMSSFVITQSLLFERLNRSLDLYKRFLTQKSDGQRTRLHEEKRKAVFVPETGYAKSAGDVSSSINEKVLTILKEHFVYGFNIDSPIEALRFRSYYESRYYEKYAFDDDTLKVEISHCGPSYKGKIYVINQDIKDRVRALISSRIELGDEAFYYDELYAQNEEWLYSGHIVEAEMLKGLIESLFPKYQHKEKYLLASDMRSNESSVLKKAILRVWGEQRLHTFAELKELLPFVPLEKIRYTLSYSNEFVWNSSETYAKVDLFEVSDEQINELIRAAEEKCLENGSVSFDDLPMEDLAAENYDLSEAALYDIVFSLLPEYFVRNGKIISMRSDQQQDTVTTIQNYCKKHETCTMTELEQVMKNTVGSIRYPVIIEAASAVMVRVSQDDFVSEDSVRFDILGIDSALDKVVVGNGIGIKEVTTFGIFPFCGYSWNHFVLESFCRRFSSKYRYVCITPNSQSVGAIVRKRSVLSYHDIMAEALARSEVELVESAAFDYLIASGFLSRRRYSDMDTLLQKALVLREGGN